jgi:hypothetical protein
VVCARISASSGQDRPWRRRRLEVLREGARGGEAWWQHAVAVPVLPLNRAERGRIAVLRSLKVGRQWWSRPERTGRIETGPRKEWTGWSGDLARRGWVLAGSVCARDLVARVPTMPKGSGDRRWVTTL